MIAFAKTLGKICLAVATLTSLAWGPGGAAAAEISVLESGPNLVPTVIIRGKLEKGDGIEFERKAGKLTRALVLLSSPGGSVAEALQIGAIIRTQRLATTVADECSSACGLIWLSGVRRYYNPGVRIGFHAAYVVRDGKPVETGMGNAEIGSFLTHLGLNVQAIRFITAAPPNGIRWLSLQDAKRLEIDVITSAANLPKDWNSGPPSYETKPVASNANLKRIYEIASIASDLVTALACGKRHRINEANIKAMHKKLMTEGERYGDAFGDALSSELVDRRAMLKRDGFETYCDNQKAIFKEAGVKGVFLD